MKRTFLLILAMAALTIVVLTTGGCNNELFNSKKSSDSILGTWQLASYKYGSNQSNFIDASPGQRHIKLITETYFTWIITDTITKKVYSAAGGTYTLSGNTYTESIDFGLGMDTYLGHKHIFTIKVEGDMFFLSGSLADGLKIEEIWQRVK